jgi:TetR/AcrR family transcriptional regulator, cholesterol catabolism regulator
VAKPAGRSARVATKATSSTRRDEIVQLARTLFAQKGYTATSTRDIADAAGMLAGSLYSHFRSKAQILSLVIAPFYEQLILAQDRILAEDAPGADRLRAMIREVLAICLDHPTEVQILHYEWPHIHANEELAELVRSSNRTLELWREVFLAGIEDDSLRPDLDPDIATRIVTSSLHAVGDSQRFRTTAIPAARGVEELAQDVIEVLLPGMARRLD